jgi:hypothetical protein
MDDIKIESNKPNHEGHPTDYRPEYCQVVEDLMAQGMSMIEVSAHLKVTKQTFLNWTKAHEEFFDSYRRGKVLCQAWWEKAGREGLHEIVSLDEYGRTVTKKINSSLWDKNVRCRFSDWKETQKIEHSGFVLTKGISKEERQELDDTLNALIPGRVQSLDDVRELDE